MTSILFVNNRRKNAVFENNMPGVEKVTSVFFSGHKVGFSVTDYLRKIF